MRPFYLLIFIDWQASRWALKGWAWLSTLIDASRFHYAPLHDFGSHTIIVMTETYSIDSGFALEPILTPSGLSLVRRFEIRPDKYKGCVQSSVIQIQAVLAVSELDPTWHRWQNLNPTWSLNVWAHPSKLPAWIHWKNIGSDSGWPIRVTWLESNDGEMWAEFHKVQTQHWKQRRTKPFYLG